MKLHQWVSRDRNGSSGACKKGYMCQQRREARAEQFHEPCISLHPHPTSSLLIPGSGHRWKFRSLLGAFPLPRDGVSLLSSRCWWREASRQVARQREGICWGGMCVCLSVRVSFVSSSPCSAVHPAGGRPRIPAPRIPPSFPPSQPTPRQAEHRPAPAGPLGRSRG